MTVRVDLKVSPQDTSWADLAATCTEAERSGAFEGVWAFDHLQPVSSGSPRPIDEHSACLEGWSVLAGLAAITTRVRIGLLVTAVPYRPPAVLAKIAATVDQMSGGRLELGLGAGNTAEEAAEFGLAFGTPGQRLDDLEHACRLLRAALHADAPDGLRADTGAPVLRPAPVQRHIPITIGGKGERRTLPMIARHGDGWNYSRGTPEEFAAKRVVLAACCEAEGRSIESICCSVQVRTDHRNTSPAVDLALAYVEAGADLIALYTQADPGAVASIADAAEHIRTAG